MPLILVRGPEIQNCFCWKGSVSIGNSIYQRINVAEMVARHTHSGISTKPCHYSPDFAIAFYSRSERDVHMFVLYIP